MPWYEAKAIVNYCHTDKEKTDYMVAELAKKYKADTIERWIGNYLPKYKKYVKGKPGTARHQESHREPAEAKQVQAKSQSTERQAEKP